MTWYRLYFLDTVGRISARDEFEADDEADAAGLAALLYDACSDACPSFELWQGARRVLPPSHHMPAPPRRSAALITQKMQETALEREELLQRSQTRLAGSKRLLSQMDQLKGEIALRRALSGS